MDELIKQAAWSVVKELRQKGYDQNAIEAIAKTIKEEYDELVIVQSKSRKMQEILNSFGNTIRN